MTELLSLPSEAIEPEEADLTDLVARAQNGDARALEVVCVAVIPTIERTVLRLEHDPNRREDHVQTGLLKLLHGYLLPRNIEDTEEDRVPVGDIRALACRVTTNAIIDTYRRGGKASHQAPILVADMDLVLGDTAAGPGPEEILVDSSLSRVKLLLERAHCDLETSKTILLRYIAGYSVAEVAEIVGCPEGTVKSRTSAGLGRVKGLLDADPDLMKGDLFENVLNLPVKKANTYKTPPTETLKRAA